MSDEEPIKSETKDPIKEAIDHPDGPSLEEMIYGKEDKEKSYPEIQKNLDDEQDS
jgi:hypothetical protein